MDPLILIVLTVVILLGIACLMLPMAAKLSIPYSVLLAQFGIVVGLLAASADAMVFPAPVSDILSGIRDIGLTGEIFLYVFLPSLLFAAGLSIDVRRLMDDIAPVLILAVVAVIICTFVVGASLHIIFAVPLALALLLGSVIATTDPAAVVAIFRDIGAPRRLQILVEGESLFNDAAAIALFTLLLGTVSGFRSGGFIDGTTDIVVDFAGGLALGFVAARAVCGLIRLLNDHPVAETTLTLCLAYAVYIIGDIYLQVSGVVATVTAALTIGSIGRTFLSSEGWTRLHAIWQQIDFLASTLIFVLAATMVPGLLSDLQWSDGAMLAVLVTAALIGRAAVLYGLMPALTAASLAETVRHRHKAVILWGGLRGAVTLAMALSVIENPFIGPEDARFVAVLATGFVLFTLFVNAPTLRPLIGMLGLNRLSPLETVLRNRIIKVSSDTVRENLTPIAREFSLDEADVERHLSPLTQPGGESHAADYTAAATLDIDDILQIGLVTLAAREEELYLEGFGDRTISRRIIGQCTAQAGRLRDAAKTGGLTAYQHAANRALKPSRAFRIALTLHNRFGIATPLSRLLGDRFEVLLATRATLHHLRRFVRRSIGPLLGRSVEAELSRVLDGREGAIDTAIRAFELQYPGYAQLLRTSYVGRAALRLEEMQYRQKRDEALISHEVYRALSEDMRRRRTAITGRPPLDLGLELTGMIKEVPLFTGMTDDQLRDIARLLRPRLAVPGERIIRKGDRGESMFFIAAGAVEVTLSDDRKQLIREAGGFFGEIAILHNTPRTAEVRSKGYCHLLVLYVRDFRRLLRQHPGIQAEIERVAQTRMDIMDAAE